MTERDTRSRFPYRKNGPARRPFSAARRPWYDWAMPEPRLSVRDFRLEDLPMLDDYWKRQTPADMTRMGIDPAKLAKIHVSPEEVAADLALPLDRKKWDRLIWEVDGQPVGMATLREIRPGRDAEIHLHVFHDSFRKRGFGHRLFAMSLTTFAERFSLERIACEPAAHNPGPNRLLQKLGIPLVRTYRKVPSIICYEHEVNRYEWVPPR